MAGACPKFVTRVGNAGANFRPTNGAVVQKEHYDNGGPVDANGTTNEVRACSGKQSVKSQSSEAMTKNQHMYSLAGGDAGEHVYDKINLSASLADSEQNQYAPLSAPPESGQNEYAPLSDYQTGDVNNIYTKLDSLEQNQRHLAEQFRDSQQRILSELSQVKDLVNTLSDLVEKSVTTAQKTSAEQEQRVQELAANLGQEVFHIGQDLMSTIREMKDEDMARQTWRQDMETNRMSSLSGENNKKSKRTTLPSL